MKPTHPLLDEAVRAYVAHGKRLGFLSAEMILMGFCPEHKPDCKCFEVPTERLGELIEALNSIAMNGTHPISRIISADETTTLSEIKEQWRALGFDVKVRVFQNWNEEADEPYPTDRNGMFIEHEVASGFYRAAAWATEDDENVFVDVRPLTEFARDLLTLCEKHGHASEEAGQ